MNKKTFVVIGIVFLIIVAAVILKMAESKGKSTPDARGYNLLVITLDTTRCDRIGVYGHSAAKTPNIDSLAQKGIMFSNCYSPAPLTLTAHASLFTGEYPFNHGVRNNGNYALPNAQSTLAEQMKNNGYKTSAVIASYVLTGKFGLNQGFQSYDDSLNSKQLYNNVESQIPAPQVYNKFMNWFASNANSLFFAWVHFYDPHIPYHAPEEFAKNFPRDMTGSYDAEVSCMDAYIGKVIDALKEKGVLDKTIVVIIGDHGESFGEHGEFGHGDLCYQEEIRVPFIIYNEELFSSSRKVETSVEIIDVMPTLLELFRISSPSRLDGKSLASILNNTNEPAPRTIYFESMHGKDEKNWAPLTGIIDGKYKYISLPEAELYDLESDKNEKSNLFWKMNRKAREMDKTLMSLISSAQKGGAQPDARRDLSEDDADHLKSLGYISSFSNKTAVALDPKKGILMETQAKNILSKLNKGKWQDLEPRIDQFVRENPAVKNMPVYFDILYRVQVLKQDLEKAIEVLKNGLEIFPSDQRLCIEYIIVLTAKGRIPDALTFCTNFMKSNPRFTRGYLALAELYEKQKNFDAAIENYKKAIETEPENSTIKMKCAELLVSKKDIKLGITLYDEIVKDPEFSNQPQFLYQVAMINAMAGLMDKAEQLLKKAIDIDQNGVLYFNYAIILATNKKLAQAVENMEIALNQHKQQLNSEQVDLGQKAIATWKKSL